MILRGKAAIAAPAFVCLALMALFPMIVESEETCVIHNESPGQWDRDNSKRIEFIQELSISEDTGNNGIIFGEVSSIAVDTWDNIYILDTTNKRVAVFDSSGRFILSFGDKGECEMTLPTVIAIDNANRVFIGDMDKLHMFDTKGTFMLSFNLINLEIIRDLKIDSEDNLYVSHFDFWKQKIVHKYSPAGEHLKSFADSYAKEKETDVRIEMAYARGYIDIDANDVIYYTQALPYEIRKFSSDGELLSRIYREDAPLKAPEAYAAIDSEKVRLSPATSSESIMILQDSLLINEIISPQTDKHPAEVSIDVFDLNGRYLASMPMARPIIFKCNDTRGRLYGIEIGERFQICRYRVVVQ